jgi:Flp pilus assembly protein TadG
MKRHHPGQNIVEAVLALPLFLLLVFGIFELSHFWQTVETTKLAAIDAAGVAAKTQNATLGTIQLLARLSQAQLAPSGATQVTANADGSSFTATATVLYRPYFGGMSIPSLAGPISIIPAQIPIQFQEIKAVSIL